MKKDYTLPVYSEYREWIARARQRGKNWNDIKYAMQGSEKGLNSFLENQRATNWWEINTTDWYNIVDLQRSDEEKVEQLSLFNESAIIVNDGEDADFSVPMSSQSAWQLYRKKLINEKGFKKATVDEMEQSVLKILKRMRFHTDPGDAVKGMVIGNVQSGKTANMAGLMAMSADWGWNMFIVLSGTIENLRKQTQSRIFSDLNDNGNLRWLSLEHLSKQSPEGSRAQDLHFEDGSNERYFTVCLKNSGRLKKLIQWLNADPNKIAQMKILVIDDEADQAGINTANIEDNERKKINSLLVNLVAGKDEKGKQTERHCQTMNYIGYTATPYANILNEAGKESLYPRSFIATLGVSKEYFGPQQIFGVTSGDYQGMDIVRTISDSDLKMIKTIHKGESQTIPDSLCDAICWFIDGVACRRLQKAHKPVSMLIHTSQKTDSHMYLENAINYWFEHTPTEEIIDNCRRIWKKETHSFTLEKFKDEYSDYENTGSVKDYPGFSAIEDYVRVLVKTPPTHIYMGDDGDLKYNEGLHICVDNCKNNGIKEDGIHMRLTYPEKKEDLNKTPAFIVIGGQTLSRGLTIEGLLCTYFLRSVGQADTLMQMGRWFGYRKGYELLMRIWLTEKTMNQFRFLSDLDQELRDEIIDMDRSGKIPANYGPKVKNTPKYSFIRITAKNRMQSAVVTDMDYSGTFSQTYLFDDDYQILHDNLNKTVDFLHSLGNPTPTSTKYRFARGTKIWRGVSSGKVTKYLADYKLQKNLHLSNSVFSLIEWINKETDAGKLKPWNIVLSDTAESKASCLDTPDGKIHMVTRTRKNNEKSKNHIIDIGALRNPKDILADVEYDKLDEKIRDEINKCGNGRLISERSKAGLEDTPQLIIYFVDKNSKATSEARLDLNAPENIAGYCLNIPGGKRGTDYGTAVAIPIENDVFDGESDLEESDGD